MKNKFNAGQYAADYFKALHTCLKKIPLEDIDKVVNLIYSAYQNGNKIFVMGNGGSASTASHFVNDLNKLCAVEGKKRFKAISLSDNIPWVTAIANDISYGEIFVEQLKNLL